MTLNQVSWPLFFIVLPGHIVALGHDSSSTTTSLAMLTRAVPQNSVETTRKAVGSDS